MLQDREILLNQVPRDELPEYFQEAYDKAERLGDAVQFQVMANAPRASRWFAESYAELWDGEVDPKLKDLVRCRMSRSAGCAVCSAWNAEDMIAAGYTAEAIDAVTAWPDPVDPAPFSPQEVAVLKYADQMVAANLDGALDADLYAELAQFFDDGQIVELGLLMGFLSGGVKFLMVADLLPRLASCPMPGAAGVDPSLKIVPLQQNANA
jgi:alkylhydroperoxidase family enzyme